MFICTEATRKWSYEFVLVNYLWSRYKGFWYQVTLSLSFDAQEHSGNGFNNAVVSDFATSDIAYLKAVGVCIQSVNSANVQLKVLLLPTIIDYHTLCSLSVLIARPSVFTFHVRNHWTKLDEILSCGCIAGYCECLDRVVLYFVSVRILTREGNHVM